MASWDQLVVSDALGDSRYTFLIIDNLFRSVSELALALD